MADPISMAAMVFQVGTQIAGAEAQGSALNQQADSAMVASRNALQVGNAREEQIRRDNAQKLGVQRAAAAQSGFDPSNGSLATLQSESAGNLELDALTARYQAQLQSINDVNQANSLRSQAHMARVGGYLNAFGTILGSAAKSAYGSPRVGPPAPIETRIPVPNDNAMFQVG